MKTHLSIHIDFISLLIPVMLLLEERLSHTLALLLAATLHECGHLLFARLLQIPLKAMHISILGARLELQDPLLSYGKEWLLCAAGPLFSFFTAGISMILARHLPHVELFSYYVPLSAGLGWINLLPIGYLDGGRMFRALSHRFLPAPLADAALSIISFLFFLLLWMTSVYLLLRLGNSLTLFVFSISLFARFFLAKQP